MRKGAEEMQRQLEPALKVSFMLKNGFIPH